MRESFAEKANCFFKEMGLEEEVKKLADLFTGNFMIEGEETEDLKEVLRRAPDSLIDLIWESIEGKEPDTEMSRQQKEESLYQNIPDYFESRFELLDAVKINLLMRVMNYQPIDTVEAANVTREFIPFGWAFCFVKNGESSFVVMKEVQNIIRTLDNPEVMERITFMNGIRYVIKTCLALYGVCTLKEICNVFLRKTDKGSENGKAIKGVEEILREILPYLEEQGVLWLDGEYIVNPYLRTKREYRELLRRQNQNYYVPDYEMIETYGQGKMLVKNKEYEAVFKLLTKEIKDQAEAEDMLEELSGYVTMEDWAIPEIMNHFYGWEVAFSSDRAVERLTAALGEWLYSIRRWSECGYSRKELHKENTDLAYITYADRNKAAKEIEKKVYPNDPCPCGSGKKYKKCCGRK